MIITTPAVTRVIRLLLQKMQARKKNIDNEEERKIVNLIYGATKFQEKHLRENLQRERERGPF